MKWLGLSCLKTELVAQLCLVGLPVLCAHFLEVVVGFILIVCRVSDGYAKTFSIGKHSVTLALFILVGGGQSHLGIRLRGTCTRLKGCLAHLWLFLS